MHKSGDKVIALGSWPPAERLKAGATIANLRAPGYLREVPKPMPDNIGLWLDRCLVDSPKTKDDLQHGREDLYHAAVTALTGSAPAVTIYKRVVERWRDSFSEETVTSGFGRKVIDVEAIDRISLHPATDATVTDGGLLLHHVYGVPYLPGSALKGLARARAFSELGSEEIAGDLFGPDLQRSRDSGDLATEAGTKFQSACGLFDFLDALWNPEAPATLWGQPAVDWSPLQPDMVNPHHPSYYVAGDKRRPPDGRDSPRPIGTITIAPGTRFRIVIEAWLGSGEIYRPWLDTVAELLVRALEEDGIGARTASGYGRLRRVVRGGDPLDDTTRGGEGVTRRSIETQPVVPQRVHARLRYQPNDGSLAANLADGRTAAANRVESASLLATLSAEFCERLKKKRILPDIELEIVPRGNGFQIVTIIEP